MWSAGDTNGNAWFAIALGDGSTGTLTNELITIITGDSGSSSINRVGYTTATRSELFDGKWHHIVVTAGSDYKIYLNGISKTITTGFGSNDGMFTDTSGIDNSEIGSRNFKDLGAGKFVDGAIDDMRIYNRALSAEEVQRLYEMGR